MVAGWQPEEDDLPPLSPVDKLASWFVSAWDAEGRGARRGANSVATPYSDDDDGKPPPSSPVDKMANWWVRTNQAGLVQSKHRPHRQCKQQQQP